MAIFSGLEPSIQRYKHIAEKFPLSRTLRLKSFLQEVHEAYYIARDPETPFIYAVIGLLGVGYVVFPGDLDFIPVIGWVDDLTVFKTCSAIIRTRASPEIVAAARTRSLRESANTVIASGKAGVDEAIPSEEEINRGIEEVDDKIVDLKERYSLILRAGKYYLSFAYLAYRHQRLLQLLWLAIVGILLYAYIFW